MKKKSRFLRARSLTPCEHREPVIVIDAGNSHTVAGVFSGATLVDDWRMPTHGLKSEKQCWIHLRLLCREAGFSPKEIRGIVIASVVPRIGQLIKTVARRRFGLQPLVVSGRLKLGIRLRYENPGTLGADRICSVVAARSKYRGSLIVVDFGTAITYDVLSAGDIYLGGAIAPGPATAAAALSHLTAALPAVDPVRVPRNPIATSTFSAIETGIMVGTIGSVEETVRRLKKAIGTPATVIATGGYAPLIAAETGAIDYLEPDLVLEGARLIYCHLRKKKAG